jgi:DNA-binding transcriptional MerR regulator
MYTVKELSKLAGITPRTLHYYDEIGLLKPSRIGDNGYRYYGEQAVLRLQQIMLFRELEVPLEEIGKLIDTPGFDVQKALERHKQNLEKKIEHLQKIVNTVESTLSYIKGEKNMTQKQLFDGLSDEQQAEYEKEALQKYDPEIVKASNKKYKGYSDEEKRRIGEEGNQVYLDLLNAMPDGADSDKVQAIIQRWRDHMNYFWTPDLDQLLGLAELYNVDPRFKANFDKISPDLAEFMKEAVKVYVSKRK